MKANLLREAIRVALEKHRSHPMFGRGFNLFSFVVEHNKLLGMGMNNRDSLVPIHYGYSKRARGWGNAEFVTCEHSELNAYRKCRGLIKSNFELINVRLKIDQHLAISAPCSCCCDWLKANGCKTVHFTTDAGWAKISLT
jgi:hypothetical protein